MAILQLAGNQMCLVLGLCVVLALPPHSLAMPGPLVVGPERALRGPSAATADGLVWNALLLAGGRHAEAIDNVLNELRRKPSSNDLDKWPSLSDLISTIDYLDVGEQQPELSPYVGLLERLYRLNGVDGSVTSTSTSTPPPPPPPNGTDEFARLPDANDSNGLRAADSGAMKQLATAEAQFAFKGLGIKKNAQFRKQYMSPCHFKICNMGRKRSARYMTVGQNY